MDLVQPTRELLETLRSPRWPVLASFLTEWPGDTTQLRAGPLPASLPVLRWLDSASAVAPAFCKALVTAIASAAPTMTWKQTYTVAQMGAAFLQSYGWSEIIGTAGALPSERLACGFLLLGPHTFYPRHHHEAEEIYVPLVGTAVWQKGDGSWREQQPGTVIHHPSYVPHAMRTSDEAVLALYLWRSHDLRQKAQLV
jgi:histidine ammonia-lyase